MIEAEVGLLMPVHACSEQAHLPPQPFHPTKTTQAGASRPVAQAWCLEEYRISSIHLMCVYVWLLGLDLRSRFTTYAKTFDLE